jgi:hypothetical protein
VIRPGIGAFVLPVLLLAAAHAASQTFPAERVPAIQPLPLPKPPAPLPAPGAAYTCPAGYVKPDRTSAVPNLKICLPVGTAPLSPTGVAASPLARVPAGGGRSVPGSANPVVACAARPGTYACGRGGAECCPLNADNPCFAGAYACKLDASRGGANTACCLK